jgi:hypothetical protein
MAARLNRLALVVLPATLTVAIIGWLLLPPFRDSEAETPLQATALDVAVTSPANLEGDPDVAPALAPAVPQTANPPETAAQLDRLRIFRQSFHRGGLGSKALVTFTVRNANDYAVKDLEILCAFRSRDGRYSTQRRRTIHETVNTKSRKAFALMPIGFVNVRAERAKCSLVTASRA